MFVPMKNKTDSWVQQIYNQASIFRNLENKFVRIIEFYVL